VQLIKALLIAARSQHPRPPTVAYLASTRRNPKTNALFEACLIRAGLDVVDCPHLLQAQGRSHPARFQCVASLESARSRIQLHAISLPEASST